MTWVKICGMRRLEDIGMINRLRPECCGFILSRPYRRYVSMNELAEMKKILDPGIQAAGVFVNESIDYISRYLDAHLIDIVQFHGNETDEMILELKNLYPDIPVIRAFTVRDSSDLAQAAESSADMILLDSGKGSGRTFAWDLLQTFERPYILAGGLDPDNITEALRLLAPYGADVSSGTETDGWKDEMKIRMFIERCREYRREGL